MSNTVRLALALALTAVTATGALAASQHRAAHSRTYSGYSNSLDAAYGAPQRGWVNVAPQAYWGTYGAAYNTPRAYWGANGPAYNAYSHNLDVALGAPPYAGSY